MRAQVSADLIFSQVAISEASDFVAYEEAAKWDSVSRSFQGSRMPMLFKKPCLGAFRSEIIRIN